MNNPASMTPIAPISTPIPPQNLVSVPPPAPKTPIFPIFFVALILVLLTVAGVFAYQNWQLRQQLNTLTTYKECLKAPGSILQESYPATCVARNGKSFTQPLTDEEKKKLQPSDEPTDWTTYTSKKYQYKINIHPDWKTLAGSPEEKFFNFRKENYEIGLEIFSTTKTTIQGYLVESDKKSATAWEGTPSTRVISTRLTKIGNYNIVRREEEWLAASFLKPVLNTYFLNDGFLYSFTLKYIGSVTDSNTIDNDVYDQILSTFKFLDKPSPTTSTQINGADLKNIKYKLSQGWETKLNNDSLLISPVNGGGYLSIRVYDYPGNVGRREYYCQVSKVCIEGTSYFTEINIGNISGYVANALDNSGGGPEYFGAKGSKFYIISSYNPPSPNEFEQNYKSVLSSLVF